MASLSAPLNNSQPSHTILNTSCITGPYHHSGCIILQRKNVREHKVPQGSKPVWTTRFMPLEDLHSSFTAEMRDPGLLLGH
ncbi:hypothetical protein O988_04808 [Pseudogymnoascus sp. VKM F-3808]|nr:hypothetical protein O988_04808 [Pseudogymnoascus sp. VKM F-3808]